MLCSFALKAVGGGQESVHHQDEALAIQTLRRQFAQLGQSKKASRRVTGHECLQVLLPITKVL